MGVRLGVVDAQEKSKSAGATKKCRRMDGVLGGGRSALALFSGLYGFYVLLINVL